MIAPWVYIYYHCYLEKKIDLPLIHFFKNEKKKEFCDKRYLEFVITVLSKYDSSLANIKEKNKREREEIYTKIILDYIVHPSFLKDFLLSSTSVSEKNELEREKNIFLSIMENNFYVTYLKKKIKKSIYFEDNFCEKYFNENKEKFFNTRPFLKGEAGYLVKVIPVDSLDDNQSISQDLKDDVKKKDTIFISLQSEILFEKDIALLLSAMTDDSYQKYVFKNNTFLVYKIKKKEKEWEDFDNIKEFVRSFLVKNEIEKKINDILKEKEASSAFCPHSISEAVSEIVQNN
jgi:hypothetical protein